MTTDNRSEAKYYNAINLTGVIGPMRLKRLFAKFKTAENIWRAKDCDLEKIGLEKSIADKFIGERKNISPDKEIEKLNKENIKLLTIFDSEYPKLLKEIYNAPVSMYIKGQMPQNEFKIAIVGSRKVSSYGKTAANNLAAKLVNIGITIVSGMAMGIDSISHNIAVAAKKPTIAVLGSGLDNKSIYPSINRRLSDEIIAAGGAIISEYPIGTMPLRHHFPQRNRIISGLSLGVIVIEAKKQSGALITARHALEQNREVFAVPGNIFSESSEGANNLIKKGAKLVNSIEDILEELNLKGIKNFQEAQKIIGDTPNEEIILKFLSKDNPVHIDKLAKLSQLDSAIASATLSVMEIKGKIKNIGGMNYILAR